MEELLATIYVYTCFDILRTLIIFILYQKYPCMSFGYFQAKAILQRHLVISDHAYTMGELKHLTNDSMILPTVRDTLKIRVREDSNRKYRLISMKLSN